MRLDWWGVLGLALMLASALLVITVAVILFSTLCPKQASAQSVRPVGWNVECKHTKFAAIDPIKGARSHTHDFSGTTPTLKSSYATMRRGATNCSRPEDTSGYWTPAMVRAEDGHLIASEEVKFYYRSNMSDKRRVAPAPANLRIIAGDAYASAPQAASVIAWDCVNAKNVAYGYSPEPFSCSGRNDQPRLSIVFPECSNGAVDSPNHKDHMAYSSGGQCPATHPRPIPELTMSVSFPSRATPSGAGQVVWENAQLATMPDQPPGARRYGAHGDWWNAWREYGSGSMAYLSAHCIRERRTCGLATP